MSVIIGNKEFLDCTECPRCKPQDGLKHGVGSITMCLAAHFMRSREHNRQMMQTEI